MSVKIMCEHCSWERQLLCKVVKILMQFTAVLEVLEGIERDCQFQQAGMTTHTAKTTMAFLQDFFSGYIVRHGFHHRGSQTSCHLDFLPWTFLKQ